MLNSWIGWGLLFDNNYFKALLCILQHLLVKDEWCAKKSWIQCVVSCMTIKYVCNSISYVYRTNKSYFYRQPSKTQHKIWGRIDKDIDINNG